MIVAGHRAPRYVLVALRHGAKFRGEARLAVFLLPRCGFPVVCYSQRVFNMFKSSVTAQEELVRTRKGYPSRRYVPADLISAPAPRARAPGPGRCMHCACYCRRAREKQQRGIAWARGLQSQVAIISRSCQLIL